MAIQPECRTILDHIVEQAIWSRSLGVSDGRPAKRSELDIGDGNGGNLGDCGVIRRTGVDLASEGRGWDGGDIFGESLRGNSGAVQSRETRQCGDGSLAQVDLERASRNCDVDS